MPPVSPLDTLKFNGDGLVPVVAQDVASGTVLMLAWATRAALEQTLATGQGHYWSRSRRELWRKGAESGHTQQVREVRVDCDADAVLYLVDQTGPACHTGNASCFFTVVGTPRGSTQYPAPSSRHDGVLTRLAATIARRAADRPDDSYTAKLLATGVAKVAQKVGEEGVETALAGATESDERLASEAADLLYHLLVLLEARGVPLSTVLAELEARMK